MWFLFSMLILAGAWALTKAVLTVWGWFYD